MNEQELIAAVRPAGRYEVVSLEDGSFTVIPIPVEAILITRESLQQHAERFRKPDN
ncbi:hypothetical protein [Enterobacter cancerogenus]|uniref:hypothetical protein n=1 Tax=Enterobacter cancerogenus TaxID=69218 RepID=UPI000AAC67DF|nr:hypothetical protein [Enterobacter cancerogenus]